MVRPYLVGKLGKMAQLYLVDAFSHAPFTGNPAGVCPLEDEAEETWMQNVAMEMNQAETAFFWPLGDSSYGLRWFTPDGEVDLCGHATLATAHVMWERGLAPRHLVRFQTKSGELRVRPDGDEIVMDFPSEPAAPFELPLKLEGAIWTGKNRMDWVAAFGSAQEVIDFKPDQSAIAAAGMRGLLITAPGEDVDFVSRFFAPLYGIPEDSVTGSAHCCLAPFWVERLGKETMRGYQASRRGGYVGVTLKGDRVELRGQARIFLEGTISS